MTKKKDFKKLLQKSVTFINASYSWFLFDSFSQYQLPIKKKKKRVNNIKWTLWMFYILYVIKTQHINSDLGLTYAETLKNLFPAHL